jgi:hypothetical protein
MIPFICFLQSQENISVLVGILTKKSQFFWLCDLGSVLGFALRIFPRKVFCFLQFWALEGSIHLLLSAISFLITTNFATEQYGHPYFKTFIIKKILSLKISFHRFKAIYILLDEHQNIQVIPHKKYFRQSFKSNNKICLIFFILIFLLLSCFLWIFCFFFS